MYIIVYVSTCRGGHYCDREQRRRAPRSLGVLSKRALAVVLPRRGRHGRAAQRTGGRRAGAGPGVYARGVERVRAGAQLRDRLAPGSRFLQPRQADRADGRALAAVLRALPAAVRSPPPVPRRPAGRHRRRADGGRPQRRLEEEALRGRVVVGVLPAPDLAGKLHPAALARHDADAVEEHPGDEAEDVEEVAQEQEVPSQRELVAVVRAGVAR